MPRPQPVMLRTLQQVAQFMGVAESTVRTNWRSAGMPGEAGAWPIAEIFWWELRRKGKPKPEDYVGAARYDEFWNVVEMAEPWAEGILSKVQELREQLPKRTRDKFAKQFDEIESELAANWHGGVHPEMGPDFKVQTPDEVAAVFQVR